MLAPAFPALLLSVLPFLAWLAVGAVGYALVLGSTNAHLNHMIGASERRGLFQGLLGFADACGSAVGPLYINCAPSLNDALNG